MAIHEEFVPVHHRITPDNLAKSAEWSLFENTLCDRSPATSLIIFQDKRYRDSFMETWGRLAIYNQEGVIIDLTPFGEFNKDSHMWGSEMNERLATSRATGTSFVCLMADQEPSYREHILPHRPELDLRIVFSGAFRDAFGSENHGKKVRVVNLDSTTGMLINGKHLDARGIGMVGVLDGWVPGHGGDVWWVRQEDGKIGAYCFSELEPIEE